MLEKGSEPGAHILSGAVMDPRAITELFPNWKELGAPLNQPVTGDDVPVPHRDRRDGARPTALLPDCFHNHGNYVISLGNVVRWLAQQAEALGVEIFPGFAAAEVLYDEDGARQGRRHRQPGRRQGRRADRRASSSAWSCTRKYTIFAEGARGHLGKQLIARFKLDDGQATRRATASASRSCGRSTRRKAKPGLVVHTAGWPLDDRHLRRRRSSTTSRTTRSTLGFVVGLDYTNP